MNCDTVIGSYHVAQRRFTVMDQKLKEFLLSRKKLFIDNICDIDDLLTYHEAAYVLSKGDVERIRCSLDRKGNRWAINEFLDCLKTKGNRGFQTFMVFLQNQNLIELLKECETHCKLNGLHKLLPHGQALSLQLFEHRQDQPNLAPTISTSLGKFEDELTAVCIVADHIQQWYQSFEHVSVIPLYNQFGSYGNQPQTTDVQSI